MAVGFKRFEDGCLPSIEFFELIQPVPDCSDGYLVKASGGLFPIAGDERDGGSLLEKVYGSLYTTCLELKLFRNGCNMVLRHVFLFQRDKFE